jgi:hypothetical protein
MNKLNIIDSAERLYDELIRDYSAELSILSGEDITKIIEVGKKLAEFKKEIKLPNNILRELGILSNSVQDQEIRSSFIKQKIPILTEIRNWIITNLSIVLINFKTINIRVLEKLVTIRFLVSKVNF